MMRGVSPRATAEPNAPRPAATVVVLAPPLDASASDAAPRLFMVRRSAKSPFMPDALVFPGGRVDVEDGPPGEDATFERAARRETLEEAALDLGDTPLRWFDTWTTPSREGRRFIARFFLARVSAAAVAGATHDGHETTDGCWDTAAGFLARWEAGDVDLPPPTICVLLELARNLGALEMRTPAQAADTILPRLAAEASTVAIVLPHDPGYDDLDGDHAPAPHRARRLPRRFLRVDGRWRPSNP
jgi:8-oxo-dGTP pyrophosphatase MutT (NUDIX family)